MKIAGLERLGYLHGTIAQPNEADASHAKWYAENQKVKGWLLTSMAPDIMKRYLRIRTAHEIWKALEKVFYDGSDESRIFALNRRAFSTKQEGQSISTYYGDLTEIFQELDYRDKVVMKDPDDVLAYRQSVERLRVHIFLVGLDPEFEQLQGEIFRKDSPLDLEETYAYVRRDAVRRATLHGVPKPIESSAMLAQHRSSGSGSNRPSDRSGSNRSSGWVQNRSSGSGQNQVTCTHCGRGGHNQTQCYQLVGYPEWWGDRPRVGDRKTNHHSTAATVADTAEASALIATSGTLGKALTTSTPNSNSAWIIDSGATDHMTFDSTHVRSFKPSKLPVVSTADGNPRV